MSAKHIEPENKIHLLLLLEHRDCRRHKVSAQFHRRLVHASDNLLRAHSLCHSLKPVINQSLQPTLSRETHRHDSHLRPAIDESLERRSIHLCVHVQHDHLPKHLWRLIHRHLQVMLHVFSSNRLFNLLLRLHIERIRVHERHLFRFRASQIIRALLKLSHSVLKRLHVLPLNRTRHRRIPRSQLRHQLRRRTEFTHHSHRVHRRSVRSRRSRR